MAMAAATSGYRQGRDYVRSQVETASQTQLVLMLYDGAIRFLSVGRERMIARQIEEQNHYLIKAQRIIVELLSSLNHTQGGDVAANLHRVYTYMLQRVVEANLHDQPDAITEVVELLRDLRTSWEEVDRLGRATGAGSGQPVMEIDNEG
jgi:flagellar secretion chaperone FliS